jgi:hypothetical protein
LIKINGGELPSEGIRVKMGTCYRRCAVNSRPGFTCATDTGFLPSQGTAPSIGVTQDAAQLCAATTDTQAAESATSLAQPIQ